MLDHTDSENLSPEEKAALARLARSKHPPESLQKHVLQSLYEKGLITAKPHTLFPYTFLRLAGTLVTVGLIFFLGYGMGQRQPVPERTEFSKPVFALFMYDSPNMSADERTRTRVYANWVRNVGSTGRFATGNKLKNTGRLLRIGNAGLDISDVKPQEVCGDLKGYILLEADNMEEALNLAATNPHLQYNGLIEIRELHLVTSRNLR